ncbi:MAG TPA: RidA family protein [Actinomycetota bacterium]|nr:RidA family protein [Actinomycetota bacterium]
MSHELLNPEGLAEPVGFAHVVIPEEGTTVYLGGQTGHRADGTLAGEDLVTQFDQACANVVTAVRAAGGEPEHLVQLMIFATDVPEYRSLMKDLGVAYRRHFGKHYPAVALLGTPELFDPQAKVELVGVAVVPEG